MTLNKFLWTLPFISFFLGYFIVNQLLNTKKELKVPYLVGKPISEGIKILSDNNLNIRILPYKEEADLQQGTIILQNPINQKVKQNQIVYLTLSKKPEFFKMPNFIGKNIEEIDKYTSKENIKTKIYYQTNINPENQCIAQSHTPDTNLEEKKIFIYISSGNNKEVIFPNFKGSNLNDIINLLKLNNLNFKIIMKNSNEEFVPGKDYVIVDQRPFSGSLVKLNSNFIIQLIVS